MTCQEFREQLDDWLRSEDDLADAPLDAALLAELSCHAAGCTPCRKLQADLLWLHRAFVSLRPPQPPADFAERVVSRLKFEPAAAPGVQVRSFVQRPLV